MFRFGLFSLLAALAVVLLQFSSAQASHWPEDCGNNKTHNFYFGSKSFYDRLLYTIQEVKTRSFLRKMSYDIKVPASGQAVSGKISYIEVLDQNNDGSGGCAYLNGGGVGYNQVTLHMKSQRNKGINFIINVWGR